MPAGGASGTHPIAESNSQVTSPTDSRSKAKQDRRGGAMRGNADRSIGGALSGRVKAPFNIPEF